MSITISGCFSILFFLDFGLNDGKIFRSRDSFRFGNFSDLLLFCWPSALGLSFGFEISGSLFEISSGVDFVTCDFRVADL